MRLDLALVIGSIFLVDQFTKFLASAYLTYAEPVGVLPFFSFTLLHNTGAAFSFLADAWVATMVIFDSRSGCFGILNLVSARDPGLCRWVRTGFVLLIPGAMGNGVDRVAFGYVVDFLHFHWGSWSFRPLILPIQVLL